MAIKTYRPTTQTLRYRTSVTTDDITSSKPHKPLVEGKIRSGGRRNSGDTTMRVRGGGGRGFAGAAGGVKLGKKILGGPQPDDLGGERPAAAEHSARHDDS